MIRVIIPAPSWGNGFGGNSQTVTCCLTPGIEDNTAAVQPCCCPNSSQLEDPSRLISRAKMLGQNRKAWCILVVLQRAINLIYCATFNNLHVHLALFSTRSNRNSEVDLVWSPPAKHRAVYLTQQYSISLLQRIGSSISASNPTCWSGRALPFFRLTASSTW